MRCGRQQYVQSVVVLEVCLGPVDGGIDSLRASSSKSVHGGPLAPSPQEAVLSVDRMGTIYMPFCRELETWE
jgi:hypothetical protein